VQELQDLLCGASRPGHFRGVATVVLKLFNIVQPDVAYFGQKDAQQARIIRQMVEDLNLPIRLRVCPIVREPDGLALSSRNQYLTPGQRESARALFLTLEEVCKRVQNGERNAHVLREIMASRIAATPGAQLDYAAIVDANSLKPLIRLKGEVLVALAVKFGTTRLIDNIQLSLDA
jgi:pantoate--beta-alanine ligase